MGRLTKAVLTTVLSLCVIFSAAPVKINANSPTVADPTKNREGYAAYLYDNTTGLPTSLQRLLTVLSGSEVTADSSDMTETHLRDMIPHQVLQAS